MSNPTCPVLHSNGSGYENLIDDYRHAFDAVTNAVKILQSHGPHSRDYYVVTGLWEKARDEHISRLSQLEAIKADILCIVGAIQQQKDERRR
jgi:hypothetical protein